MGALFKVLSGDPTIVAPNYAAAAYEGTIGQRSDNGELWQVQGAAWVKLQGATSTGALINVANIAAMQALPAAALADGAPVLVRTVQRVFFLTTTAAGALAANDTYTSTVAGRLWMGSDVSNYNYWRSQATWTIDPAAGNDEATGVDLAHAIKTCAERRRRCGRGYVVPQPTTITYDSGPPSSDVELFSRVLTGSGASLTIQGKRSVVATGTLTGFTAFNRATQTKNSIADTGLAGGFAAHVGRFVRVTAGPRINSSWIITRDLGGGAAEISTPGITSIAATGSFTRLAPQVGDAYEIVTVPLVSCGEWAFGAGSQQLATGGVANRVVVQDLELDWGNKSTSTTTDFASGVSSDNVRVVMVRCRQDAISVRSNNAAFFQCYYFGYIQVLSGTSMFLRAGAHTSHVNVLPGGYAVLDFDELFESGSITLARGGTLEVGTACVFNKVGNAVGANPGSTLICVTNLDGVTALWGTSNTVYGLSVDAGGQVLWQGSVCPITVNAGLGLGREVKLGLLNVLYADLPAESGGARAGQWL